ncbi:DNA polymerase III subunit gamma/tau [Weissella halotolerans]|uniref:DNA-directed DNA polymerase n=1 Tax=Weissella halotolerans DSM 20190 TaxID=1123500 RepID=A0A0R2G6D2_9LACO|nr:DNA polymerase III subunit gamma/tau [Weissella halotolerans]KRN32301.1 DNA-directed DNA polymerase [Weissella halotolerans DSM 20190]
MAYQALYRTWRPQKFSDMVGQEVVTKTLQNTIISHQISHAYLFTGPRGTGKTSAAKIFAKAVNCLHPIDGEPDETCELCLAANQGSLGDIIELDAASNNGVDEIRQIREDVNYAPTQAKYKVYIIDEVHMLSTGAFNALLKTLEEPPANVIFILATTEPQKIPATIISRTQRFDFKRIDAQAAYDRMVYILNERGSSYEEAALRVIAKAADGGMRDALSILDQVLSFGDGRATLENALLVTGSVRQNLLGEYVQAVVAGQTPAALVKVTEVLAAGKDANRFIEDLISYARDLLLYTEAPDLISLVPDDNFDQLAKNSQPATWYEMIDVLNETQQQLRFTNRPSVYLEVLTVKLSQGRTSRQSKNLPVDKISAQPVNDQVALKKTPVQPVSQAKASTRSSIGNEQPDQEKEPVASQQVAQTARQVENGSSVQAVARVQVGEGAAAVFQVLQAATRGDLSRVQTIWAGMVNMLAVPQQAMLNVAKPIAASPEGLVIAFDYDVIRVNAKKDQHLLAKMVQEIRVLSEAKHDRSMVFITSDEWPKLRATYLKDHQVGHQDKPSQPAANDLEAVTESVEPDASVENDTVVTEAEKIFNQDLIETTDD